MEISLTRSESIGSVSDWQLGDELDLPYQLAQTFLAYALGDPPEGVRVGLQYHDHDLGSYPTLSVIWREFTSEPTDFIRRAEYALREFNQAVDWSRLHPSLFEPDADEEVDR